MTMAMKMTPSSTTSTSSSRRPARPLAYLLIATITGSCHSYAPSKISSNAPLSIRGTSSLSTTSLSARLPPGSSRGKNNKAVVKKPAWQENAEYWAEREALEKLNKNGGSGGSGGGSGKNAEILDYLDDLNDGGNTFAKIYVPKSTDDFKKSYDPDSEDNNNMFAPNVPPPRKPKQVESERSSSNPPLNAAEQEGHIPSWFGSNERQPDNNGRNIEADRNVTPTVSNNAADANRHSFQMSSTDDFRKPHGSVPNNVASGNNQQRQSTPPPPPPPQQPQQGQSFNPNADRHSFQSSSTDDFRKPHGMPSNMEQQQRPPPASRQDEYKSPFQTSSTDDFRRSSDVASGVGATQQPIFQRPDSRSENPAWRNGVGQDTYGSTLNSKQQPSSQGGGGMPNQFQNLVDQAQNFGEQAQHVFQSMQPPKFMDAMIIDNDSPQPPTTQSAAAPAMASNGLEEWDQRLQTAHTKSSQTMIRRIQWPLSKDPPGVYPDHPLLATRVFATVLATLSTRYLHLYAGYSPVLASSAMTLLLSTCLDRRLGQAALCGSLAGMSGGHLTSTLPVAVGLGAATSACYEVAIRINNACLGIGGRLGATAFLATSIVARYQRVGGVGRKLRRGLWKSGGGGLSDIAVSMVLYHVLGSMATILLRESSSDDAGGAADPVRASSVVGLLGSLFLKDPTAVLALYGGSFVGMSLPSRLMNGSVPDNNIRAGQRLQTTAVSLFSSFAGAGAMAGLLHAISIHAGYWNGGWGGKVGLCAFAGCWVYRGFGNVAQFIKRRT